MDPFANARTNLRNLAAAYRADPDVNEATTRLRLIDELLVGCLGWSKAEIVAEEYADRDYIDYAVGKPATEMIVEAKRTGSAFNLPAGVAGRRSVQISTLLTDTTCKNAIEQVLRYAQKMGVPVAVICNGHQLVAFYASRQDGVPPLQGMALCFSSLEEMEQDFQTLWAHLSREGIAQRNLQRTLLRRSANPLPPPKLSESIPGFPGFRMRTSLETDLRILAGIFLQDLENEDSVSDEFVRECYCSSGALTQYALVSREILTSRYAALESELSAKPAPVRTKHGLNKELPKDVVAAAMSRRPLILLGDVGVGKTMFLRHLISVDAAAELENSLIFYINFGNEPALQTDLEKYVFDRVAAILLASYGMDIYEANFVRATYNGELNRFRRSPAGEIRAARPELYLEKEIDYLNALTSDSVSHLKRALEHIRASHARSSVVILDNIDQRPAEFQDRVFLIGQALASSWPSTVFISMRPSTFHESRANSSLTGYQLRVFTVSPTRVDEVINRRIKFARTKVTAASQSGALNSTLTLSGENLVTYLDCLEKSFSENDDLKELLENLSGGNLRSALTFLSSFVGSGYVSTERILDTAANGGAYTIPVHEFLRSIIFNEYDYYNPRESDICNLFDISTNDGREHFLLSILLAQAERLGRVAGSRGFVNVAEFYGIAQELGFTQEQVGTQLERALAKKLLDTTPGNGNGGPLRITSVGAYMYASMVRRFSYVDAMVSDTPIIDYEVRRQITDARSIVDRLDRAELFRVYLDDQWTSLEDGVNLPFDWRVASAALQGDIGDARIRAARRAAIT